MRKIRLDLEELEVESFEIDSEAGRGTVLARNWTVESCFPVECEPIQPDDSINYCGPPPTAYATCGSTCGGSCGCVYPTRVGWTCDPYASECLPVPEDNPPL